jgi:hypothetical protein
VRRMQSGLVGGEGLSITFKLGLKRSIQHIRLSRTTVISTPKTARSNLKLHHLWRLQKGSYDRPRISLLGPNSDIGRPPPMANRLYSRSDTR